MSILTIDYSVASVLHRTEFHRIPDENQDRTIKATVFSKSVDPSDIPVNTILSSGGFIVLDILSRPEAGTGLPAPALPQRYLLSSPESCVQLPSKGPFSYWGYASRRFDCVALPLDLVAAAGTSIDIQDLKAAEVGLPLFDLPFPKYGQATQAKTEPVLIDVILRILSESLPQLEQKTGFKYLASFRQAETSGVRISRNDNSVVASVTCHSSNVDFTIDPNGRVRSFNVETNWHHFSFADTDTGKRAPCQICYAYISCYPSEDLPDASPDIYRAVLQGDNSAFESWFWEVVNPTLDDPLLEVDDPYLQSTANWEVGDAQTMSTILSNAVWAYPGVHLNETVGLMLEAGTENGDDMCLGDPDCLDLRIRFESPEVEGDFVSAMDELISLCSDRFYMFGEYAEYNDGAHDSRSGYDRYPATAWAEIEVPSMHERASARRFMHELLTGYGPAALNTILAKVYLSDQVDTPEAIANMPASAADGTTSLNGSASDT